MVALIKLYFVVFVQVELNHEVLLIRVGKYRLLLLSLLGHHAFVVRAVMKGVGEVVLVLTILLT